MLGWQALPDWAFSAAGALFCISLVVLRLPDHRYFWELGPFFEFADGRTLHLPFVRLLNDWTYLLIIAGFCFRIRPRRRNNRGDDVAVALMGSYWLFTPYLILYACQFRDSRFGTGWAGPFEAFWMADTLSLARMLTGTALVTVGNLIDMWGYAVLCRSFSLVPEARELRKNGPYRLLRHPVYLGQVIAQAGVYFCFANWHPVWVLFWLGFAGIQMRRAWREEQVLGEAFGEEYLGWKRGTLWFW